jgi:hypothetical protein
MPIHINDANEIRATLKILPPAPLPACAERLYDEIKSLQRNLGTTSQLPPAVILILCRDIQREMKANPEPNAPPAVIAQSLGMPAMKPPTPKPAAPKTKPDLAPA